MRSSSASPVVLTLIYAAYVIGNLVSLFFFGGVSDRAGRRRIVLRAMIARSGQHRHLLLRIEHGVVVRRARAEWILDRACGRRRDCVDRRVGQRRRQGARALVASRRQLRRRGAGPLFPVCWRIPPWPLQLPFLIYIAFVAITAVFIARSPETVSDSARRPKSAASIASRDRSAPLHRAGRHRVHDVLALRLLLFSRAQRARSRACIESNRAVGGAVVFELGLVSAATILVTRRLASRTCMRWRWSCCCPHSCC